MKTNTCYSPPPFRVRQLNSKKPAEKFSSRNRNALSSLRMLVMVGLGGITGCQSHVFDLSKYLAGQPEESRIMRVSSEKPTSKGLPNDEAAKLQLAVADEQLRHGRDSDALGRYECARKINPQMKGVAHPMAVIHDAQGNHGQALTEYRKAIDENPRDATVLNDMGYSYYLRGEWSKAEEAFRRSIQIKESPRAWNNLGLAYGQSGRYRESLAAFKKATDPARAYGNLGFVFLTQGKTQQARLAYKKAIQLDPSYDMAHQVLAKIDAAED